MKLKWLGHSCFLLTSGAGTRVVTDPFDQSIGYPLPEVETDIATKSHDHFDHNYIQALKGNFEVVDTAGSHVVRDVRIAGIETWHDAEKGKRRGKNRSGSRRQSTALKRTRLLSGTTAFPLTLPPISPTIGINSRGGALTG